MTDADATVEVEVPAFLANGVLVVNADGSRVLARATAVVQTAEGWVLMAVVEDD